MAEEARSDKSAQAKRLVDRITAGKTSVQKVALAAYLGYTTARMVVGSAPEGPDDIKEWLKGIGNFGREGAARAALGLARMVLHIWTEDPPPVESIKELPTHIICAAESWVMHQTPKCAAHLDGLLEHAEEETLLLVEQARLPSEAAILSLAIMAGRCCSSDFEKALCESCDDAMVLLEPDQIRSCVRTAVYPWALGVSDPLKDDPTTPESD